MKEKEKKLLVISTISIFIINFLIHEIYKFISNDFTAIFFPVNESIYEHMKMLFTSYFIYSLILIFIPKKYKINNILFGNMCAGILNIIIYLLFYLPFYYRFGEHFIYTIILLFISILLTNYLIKFIYQKKESKNLKIISIILFPMLFTCFAYFTYHPIETPFFFDPIEEIYGIPKKE